MMKHKDIPHKFWAEALATMAYVLNRVTGGSHSLLGLALVQGSTRNIKYTVRIRIFSFWNNTRIIGSFRLTRES